MRDAEALRLRGVSAAESPALLLGRADGNVPRSTPGCNCYFGIFAGIDIPHVRWTCGPRRPGCCAASCTTTRARRSWVRRWVCRAADLNPREGDFRPDLCARD